MEKGLFSHTRLLDFAIVAIVLFLALAIWLSPFVFSDEGNVAELTVGDKTEYISLYETRRIEIENGGVSLVLCVEDGEVWIEQSTCPDGVCVNSGKISREGEIIVCAPAAVTVKISFGGDFDALA